LIPFDSGYAVYLFTFIVYFRNKLTTSSYSEAAGGSQALSVTVSRQNFFAQRQQNIPSFAKSSQQD